MNPHTPASNSASTPPPSGSTPLDLYLDGLLNPVQRAEFEARVAQDPDLRREVELGRALEASIARAFPVPSRIDPTPRPLPIEGAGRRTSPLTKAVAVAAVIALLVFVGYNVWGPVPFAPEPRITPSALYHRLISNGYKPEFVCATDEEFAREVKKRLGQPLLFAPKTGIELVGWAYSGGYSGGMTLSPNTLILMTRVQGKEVIVLMDRARTDRQMPQPEDPALKMFRGRIGKLVLYEISPCEDPVLLNQAYDPVAQPEGPPPVEEDHCESRRGRVPPAKPADEPASKAPKP